MTGMVESLQRRRYVLIAMKKQIRLAAMTGALLAATPAAAQMFPGQGITVNPGAVHGAPATSGQSGPYSGIVTLHMPMESHHRHVAVKKKPKASKVARSAPADTAPTEQTPPKTAPTNSQPSSLTLDSLSDTLATVPAPEKKTKHASVKTAATPPPSPAPDSSSDTGQSVGLPLSLAPDEEHPVQPPPKHKKSASIKNDQAPPADATAMRTAEMPPKTSDDTSASSGLAKRSEILFARGEPDVSSANVDKMRAVAADLNTLLGAGAQRVQLDAYGGTPKDKGSEARRLSLKRALGIRQLLIEDGVPSEKIDVRAMGGIDDHGSPDRVDVLVRGS